MPNDLFEAARQRYGLTETPYGEVRPLDPIEHPSDRDLLVKAVIDTFSETIEGPLQRAHAEGEPVFFLVAGRSRSGRSTMANFILDLHRELRGINRAQFVVPQLSGGRDSSGHDPYALFKDWIRKWLFYELKKKNLIPLAFHARVTEIMREATDEDYERHFLEFVDFTHQRLRDGDPSAGFGVCIENVRTIAHVDAALEIFQFTPVAVVFTVVLPPHAEASKDAAVDVMATLTDSQHDYRSKIQLVDLQPLPDDVVAEVASVRWNGPDPAPFELGVFDGAFGKEAPTFGRTLSTLARLLQTRAAQAPPGIAWPHDSLKYTGNQVRETLPVLGSFR